MNKYQYVMRKICLRKANEWSYPIHIPRISVAKCQNWQLITNWPIFVNGTFITKENQKQVFEASHHNWNYNKIIIHRIKGKQQSTNPKEKRALTIKWEIPQHSTTNNTTFCPGRGYSSRRYHKRILLEWTIATQSCCLCWCKRPSLFSQIHECIVQAVSFL